MKLVSPQQPVTFRILVNIQYFKITEPCETMTSCLNPPSSILVLKHHDAITQSVLGDCAGALDLYTQTFQTKGSCSLTLTTSHLKNSLIIAFVLVLQSTESKQEPLR